MACLTTFVADFDLCFFDDDDDDDDGIDGSRISERARQNSLGVEMGEREGIGRERGVSMTCDGLLFSCGGGMI